MAIDTSVGKRSAEAPEPIRILMFLLYASSASIGSNIIPSLFGCLEQ